jgi:hypothetical protein
LFVLGFPFGKEKKKYWCFWRWRRRVYEYESISMAFLFVIPRQWKLQLLTRYAVGFA